METRVYKEIINDIRGFSSENKQLSEDEKALLNKCADELESKSKYSKFIILILFILFMGCLVVLFLSSIENDNLKTDLSNKKNLIESYEKIIRFENDSTHSFTYRTKNGNAITYQELIDENFDLLKKNSNLEYEVKKRDLFLDLIKDNYGIRVKESNNQIWAEGEKVDSALLLLDLYRDKVKYDSQTKTWSVSR